MFPHKVFKPVDHHCAINNVAHHTIDVSDKVLIVRRGEPFVMTVTLNEPFKNTAQPLFIRINLGEDATEEKGTLCNLSIPDGVKPSPNAKAVWKVDLDRTSSPYSGVLVLNFTPPADAPIGQFCITGKYGEAEIVLAEPTVLFNPWCREDSVYMSDENERKEYVMNEQGKIYRGSQDYIMGMDWDFGQFEENMVDICLSLLHNSNEHIKDPAEDFAKRADPGYVGRVMSAMINSSDDRGVVQGRWGGSYADGRKPTHWMGSSALLTQWLQSGFRPVKYGQCWVFAGVMCSVLRFLGIPCRVISNFNSAHDTDANLTIDVFRAEPGAFEMPTTDSIWNFHVWVEGYMKRPDLSPAGSYDGWQVLDPTPQELSDGVYCCGPAPKKAILKGTANVDYDVPFVYAEVNADINVWMSKPNYSLERVESDNEHVGKYISTKAVGTEERADITLTYKPVEGTFTERLAFVRAVISNHNALIERRRRERMERDSEILAAPSSLGNTEARTASASEVSGPGPDETPERMERESEILDAPSSLGNTEARMASASEVSRPGPDETPEASMLDGVSGRTAARTVEREEIPAARREVDEVVTANAAPRAEEVEEDIPPPPRVFLKFEEVTQPINGQDVKLNLILTSEITADRPLVIHLEVFTMQYFGLLTNQILKDTTMETLKPGSPLVIPIVVPFSQYMKPMLDSDSMVISALVLDQVNPHHPYIKERNVVLMDPPLEINLLSEARLFQSTTVEVVFTNTVAQVLRNCTLSISGSGLRKTEFEANIQDIYPSTRIRMQFNIFPYKVGRKTLSVDFDCSVFRDIKGRCIIDVKP